MYLFTYKSFTDVYFFSLRDSPIMSIDFIIKLFKFEF